MPILGPDQSRGQGESETAASSAFDELFADSAQTALFGTSNGKQLAAFSQKKEVVLTWNVLVKVKLNFQFNFNQFLYTF